MSSGTGRRLAGFTLIELLMVAVIGAIILTGAVRLLVGQQRTQTVLTGRETVQESLRTGLAVLLAEFREVSPAEGDIVAMESDSIIVRATRRMGIVCDLTRGASPSLTVAPVGTDFAATDSITVFAANRPGLHDDVWIQGTPTSVTSGATCSDGSSAQVIALTGMAAPLVADTVREGAPIRSFEHVTYGLYQDGASWYLGSRISGGAVDLLVGPLLPRSSNGLQMTYLDEFGNTTTTPADVRRIRVTLRAESSVRNAQGALVADSLSGMAALRN